MDTSWLGAAVSGSASHVNLLASSLWNQRMQRKQFEQEKSLQEDAQAFTTSERLAQQDYQTEMWNLQNAYDTPSAQMQRLKDAGINPNSIMSGNQVGSTGATPVSPPSGATSPMGHAPNMPYIDGAAINNSIVAGAEAAKLFEEAIGQKIENQYKGQLHAINIKQAESIIEVNKKQVDKLVSESNLNDAQTEQIYAMLPQLVAKSDAEIANLEAATKKYDAESKNLFEQLRLLDEQIKTEKKRQSNIDASTNLLGEQAETERKSQELIGQQTSTEYQNTKLKELDNERGKVVYDLEKVKSAYEGELYSNGIDPSKIDYKFTNLLGQAIAIRKLIRKH